jgi:tRNA-splicing ligase RtcB (3'-phosphate/5'-hydroxy nucleic acid ligase)
MPGYVCTCLAPRWLPCFSAGKGHVQDRVYGGGVDVGAWWGMTMESRNTERLLRALAREGLEVTFADHVYSVRWKASPAAPRAEVLLPDSLPLEAEALTQLASLAMAEHPLGGRICRVCATPDFHPGDAGIAIGSIVETEGQVIPAAVGADINCGMRLHVVDLPLDRFLAYRDRFVEVMKGDYFFGTRDVTMAATTMHALFAHGVPGWVAAMLDRPTGSVVRSDVAQLAQEVDRIFLGGTLPGDVRWAPQELVPLGGVVRDGGLGTLGGGNHFVEIQTVEAVDDRTLAHAWGMKEGQLAFMVHCGSRLVSKYIGGMWRDRAREAWPKGLKYPRAHIFPLSATATPDLVADYLQAEATAANYGFVNRLLVGELLRLRLRELFGPLGAPLVYDLSHNITLAEGRGWVTRKGACPAYAGQPVIIPGSMGAASYLLVGPGGAAFPSVGVPWGGPGALAVLHGPRWRGPRRGQPGAARRRLHNTARGAPDRRSTRGLQAHSADHRRPGGRRHGACRRQVTTCADLQGVRQPQRASIRSRPVASGRCATRWCRTGPLRSADRASRRARAVGRSPRQQPGARSQRNHAGNRLCLVAYLTSAAGRPLHKPWRASSRAAVLLWTSAPCGRLPWTCLPPPPCTWSIATWQPGPSRTA